MKKSLAILCLIPVVLLSGCISKPVSVPVSFWQQPETTVVIVATEPPKQGDFVMMGNQGLLDLAIAAAVTSEVRAATRAVKADAFQSIATEFEAELAKAGFKTAVVPDPVSLEKLPARSGGSGSFDRDVTSLAKPYGARYVIILELLNYGAIRTYYAFVPTSTPSGFAAVRGRMISAADHKVVWDIGTAYPQNTVQEPVTGEWKQAPEYANLIEATNAAVLRSKQLLRERFFETMPASAPVVAAAPATAAAPKNPD